MILTSLFAYKNRNLYLLTFKIIKRCGVLSKSSVKLKNEEPDCVIRLFAGVFSPYYARSEK